MTTLLSCAGLDVGRFFVPAFEVRSGELVRVAIESVLRRENGSTVHDSEPERGQIVNRFSGVAPDERVTARGRVEVLPEFLAPIHGLSECIRPATCLRWLQRSTRCSQERAMGELLRVGLDPERRLNTMAGNPRRLLSLAAARITRPDIVVCTPCGMDPLGVRKLLDHLRSDIENSAAIVVDPFFEAERGVRFDREIPCRQTVEAA